MPGTGLELRHEDLGERGVGLPISGDGDDDGSQAADPHSPAETYGDRQDYGVGCRGADWYWLPRTSSTKGRGACASPFVAASSSPTNGTKLSQVWRGSTMTILSGRALDAQRPSSVASRAHLSPPRLCRSSALLPLPSETGSRRSGAATSASDEEHKGQPLEHLSRLIAAFW